MALYNQHDFKEWGKNQRIMLHGKTWFMTLTPPLLKNGSPSRLCAILGLRDF